MTQVKQLAQLHLSSSVLAQIGFGPSWGTLKARVRFVGWCKWTPSGDKPIAPGQSWHAGGQVLKGPGAIGRSEGKPKGPVIFLVSELEDKYTLMRLHYELAGAGQRVGADAEGSDAKMHLARCALYHCGFGSCLLLDRRCTRSAKTPGFSA